MSKKKITNQIEQLEHRPIDTSIPLNNPDSVNESGRKSIFGNCLLFIKSHALVSVIICFLALGAVGAGLKYLEEDARREIARRDANKGRINTQPESVLNKINPFLPAALPNPTPQLAKEYIYAGSRLLAVEDANATPAALADLTVWRPSNGTWYVMGGPGSQPTSLQWGLSGDVPVPGDFDGDGKADFAVFRPSSNDWWIFKSSDNNFYAVNFGMAGDKLTPADFDGDGKTDIAVFRPSNGGWYILQSTNSAVVVGQFGISTDIPAAADYNGDGKAEFAVWRNGDTSFYISTGALTYDAANMGAASTQPVSADYDGDGKADCAVRESGTSNWRLRTSSNYQIQTVSWELAGDLAVPADYDGDGKTDVAVWREANGTWYIRKSTDNSTRTVQWGLPDDIPVPAYYRR